MRPRLRSLAVLLAAGLLLPTGALAADSDGDGLRDGFERRHGLTSPYLADSDGDGVIDASEDPDGDQLGNRGEQRFGTHPGLPDSDSDGIPDGLEDDDGNGRPDALDQERRRVPDDLRPSLAAAADDISVDAPRCGVNTADAEVNRCHFGDVDGEITVALMGDSKATMYLPPLSIVAEEEGWHLVTLLKGRCTPIMGTMPRYMRLFDDGDSCKRWRASAFEWLRRRQPDLILMVFSDDYILVDRANRQLKGPRLVKALQQGTAKTMAELPDGSTVVLLADSPKQAFNPVKCLQRDPSDMSACVTVETPASAGLVDRVLRAAVIEGGGAYRSLHDRICPYQPCPLVQGNILVYRDKGHLTVTFTEQLAPSLREELLSLLPPEEMPEPTPEATERPLPFDPWPEDEEPRPFEPPA